MIPLIVHMLVCMTWSMPGREGAAVEEGLGGPLAEVDGEGDAVAVEAGEDDYLIAAGMRLRGKPAEDGAHSFGEEDRAGPPVGDEYVGEGGVQMADAVFEPAEAGGGFASANVVAAQIVRGVLAAAAAEGKAGRRAYVGGDQAGAEDDAI